MIFFSVDVDSNNLLVLWWRCRCSIQRRRTSIIWKRPNSGWIIQVPRNTTYKMEQLHEINNILHSWNITVHFSTSKEIKWILHWSRLPCLSLELGRCTFELPLQASSKWFSSSGKFQQQWVMFVIIRPHNWLETRREHQTLFQIMQHLHGVHFTIWVKLPGNRMALDKPNSRVYYENIPSSQWNFIRTKKWKHTPRNIWC